MEILQLPTQEFNITHFKDKIDSILNKRKSVKLLDIVLFVNNLFLKLISNTIKNNALV